MLKTRANQKPLVIPKDIYGAIALMCVKIKKGDSLKMVDVSGSQRSDGNIVKKGFGDNVDVSNLKRGTYYINYDKDMGKFLKK